MINPLDGFINYHTLPNITVDVKEYYLKGEIKVGPTLSKVK